LRNGVCIVRAWDGVRELAGLGEKSRWLVEGRWSERDGEGRGWEGWAGSGSGG